MKAIRCPSCNGDLDIPENKEFIECPYCGTDIQIRDFSQSKINIPNILSLAKSALEAKNYSEAYNYYTKILEANSNISEAWLGKGKVVLVNSASDINKLSEMIIYFKKCIECSSPENKEKFENEIINSVNSVTGGYMKYVLKNYSLDSANRVCPAMIESLIFIYELNRNNEIILENILNIYIYLSLAFLAYKDYPDRLMLKENQIKDDFDKYNSELEKLNPKRALFYKDKLQKEITVFLKKSEENRRLAFENDKRRMADRNKIKKYTIWFTIGFIIFIVLTTLLPALIGVIATIIGIIAAFLGSNK